MKVMVIAIVKRLEDLEVVENGQNTEKSPRDLRRLAVTRSSERLSANVDAKNSQGVNNYNNNDNNKFSGILRYKQII